MLGRFARWGWAWQSYHGVADQTRAAAILDSETQQYFWNILLFLRAWNKCGRFLEATWPSLMLCYCFEQHLDSMPVIIHRSNSANDGFVFRFRRWINMDWQYVLREIDSSSNINGWITQKKKDNLCVMKSVSALFKPGCLRTQSAWGWVTQFE